jgi:hypothetical protein
MTERDPTTAVGWLVAALFWTVVALRAGQTAPGAVLDGYYALVLLAAVSTLFFVILTVLVAYEHLSESGMAEAVGE